MISNNKRKSIAIRFEGGTGDVLLFNRYLPAIQEKWPDHQIHAYLDTEGNDTQRRVLEYLYGDWYASIETITHKKYKEFWIESEYGLENQIGFIENVPDEWMKKIRSHDIFINGHLDSLDFVSQKDYDWTKYFTKFPEPMVKEWPRNVMGNYIVSHLISSTSKEHRHEDFYITRLVKDLDKFCKEIGYRNILISTPDFNQFYTEALKSTSNTDLVNGMIIDVCDIILNAKMMISVDSGFRPIAYPLMPVISFSKQCFAPNQMNVSHIIRWNPIKPYFPLNWNSPDIVSMAQKLLENKLFNIFPELPSKWEQFLIKRNYKVNEEKSN